MDQFKLNLLYTNIYITVVTFIELLLLFILENEFRLLAKIQISLNDLIKSQIKMLMLNNFNGFFFKKLWTTLCLQRVL